MLVRPRLLFWGSEDGRWDVERSTGNIDDDSDDSDQEMVDAQ
jgi:hypothetical protein